MSRHDDQVSLKDMLSHASEAADLLADMDREGLARHRVMQLALTRLESPARGASPNGGEGGDGGGTGESGTRAVASV